MCYLSEAYFFRYVSFADISEEELKKFQEEGKIVVAGHELSGNDLKVRHVDFHHESSCFILFILSES